MNALPGSNRVPAEWEPQAAIWLAWPHHADTWPGRFDQIPGFFADWARLIAESTPVRIIGSKRAVQQSKQRLGQLDHLEWVEIATNDCWIRDYGPTFVADPGGKICGVNWRFNAWGEKYPPWGLDDAAGNLICDKASLAATNGQLCLEGGAMEVDGRGRMLTTPHCLVTETRNPGWSQREISQELHRQLGITEIVWLDGGGLVGDDTDGHIDQLARFIDERNVVVAVSDHAGDPSAPGLLANYRQLQLWGGATDPKVEVHRLPIPPARLINGQRVPESYCNFLRLGPSRLLVPTFGATTDDAAIGILKELSRADVVPVDCRDLVWGLGALHCASRDQPAQL